MDEAYEHHHVWVFPKLDLMPSEYFRRNGAASFQEDPPGVDLMEKYGLEENFMWANDYPHHEGSWPHSEQAIERTMGALDDSQREKLLGANAARFFGFDVDRLLAYRNVATVQA
jgi:predicted TIM-barrel fold metal-dependent hydrolase